MGCGMKPLLGVIDHQGVEPDDTSAKGWSKPVFLEPDINPPLFTKMKSTTQNTDRDLPGSFELF